MTNIILLLVWLLLVAPFAIWVVREHTRKADFFTYGSPQKEPPDWISWAAAAGVLLLPTVLVVTIIIHWVF